MNYWKSQGAPTEKQIFGVPTYGNTFTLRNPANHSVGAPTADAATPGRYTQVAGELANFEVHFVIIVSKLIKISLTTDGGLVLDNILLYA